MFSTLRWRILASFVLVIALAVALSIGVAYWSSRAELRSFVNVIAQEQLAYLASVVEGQYIDTKDWEDVRMQLAQWGYDANFVLADNAFSELAVGADFAIVEEGFPQQELTDALGVDFADGIVINTDELPPEEFMDTRVLILDLNDVVIFDGFGELTGEMFDEALPGASRELRNLQTGEPIGRIAVEVSNIYLQDEADTFLSGMLYSTLAGGLMASAVALLIAVVLAQRITAPVSALTNAATRLAESGSSEQLPVQSADELGQMSAAFNQLTRALDTQKQLRQRLVSDVSHELGTPLSVIRLETQAMQDGMQSPDEAARAIQDEVDVLHSLVQDLDLFTEGESGGLVLQKESINSAEFLTQTAARWQTRAELKSVALTLDLPPTLPTVALDTVRMHQVMGNLIKNGLQYTDAGGEIRIAAQADQNEIAFYVADTGCGISAEHLPHIFDRFYRADSARHKASGGRGLGLAIAKRLVGLHGGRISAESDGTSGSRFCVALPLDK